MSENTKRTSRIKEYFTKRDSISSRCKICCNILKHHGNTTNLSNHMKRKHPNFLTDNPPARKPNVPSPFCKHVPENDHLDDDCFEVPLFSTSESANRSESPTIISQPACSKACSKSPDGTPIKKQRSIDKTFKRIDAYAGNISNINFQNLILLYF